MARRFVDLSIFAENAVIPAPSLMRPKITCQRHGETMKDFNHFLSGVKAKEAPDTEGISAAAMAASDNGVVNTGCDMGSEAPMHLPERGVRATGTDAWTWDAPFSHTARKVSATGGTSLIREGHEAGPDIGYCHLEKLLNLEGLPPFGFTVCCFPHKVRGTSAGWTRAVAIFEE